jgi:hypothetical protein
MTASCPFGVKVRGVGRRVREGSHLPLVPLGVLPVKVISLICCSRLHVPAADPLNESGNIRSAEVIWFRFEHFIWPG